MLLAVENAKRHGPWDIHSDTDLTTAQSLLMHHAGRVEDSALQPVVAVVVVVVEDAR